MSSIKIYLKKIKLEASYQTQNNPRFDVNHNERDQFLIRLDELELSVRTLNSLTDQGVTTIGTLVFYEEKDLKTFPGMGATSLNEIKDMLNLRSLRLGMEIFEDKDDQPEEIREVKYEEKEILDEINIETTLELIKEFDETTLSVRSKNVLRNLDCYNIGHIISLSKRLLLLNNNLGIKSVVEIEKYINNLGFNFGDIIKPWNKDIIKQLRDDLSGKISDEARQELIEKNKYLEVELQKILEECIKTSNKDQSIKDRIIDVLINRFGLDGSPAKTLEIIGQKYNITRERIRQNQENGLRKLRILKPFTPILDKVFEELFKTLPVTEIEFNKILKEKNLTQVEWDFKGLQDFYENFGTKTGFYIIKVNGIKIITDSSKESVAQKLLMILNKKISSNGLFSVSKTMELKEIYLNNIKEEIIRKIVRTKVNFNWLDSDHNWFTFGSQRNRLTNLISKAATVSKILNIEILYNSIRKIPRIEIDLFNDKKIFMSFCKIAFDVAFDDSNHITFNSLKSKISNFKGREGRMIAPNEQKMINIFNDYGPILYIGDLKEFASLCIIKSDSLTMMLQYSPTVYKIDFGFYSLTGKKMENKEEKLISIIELESSTFLKEECAPQKKSSTYVEVNKNGALFKALPYQRPLRILPDGSYGVVYKKEVYPIMKSFTELNGKRVEKKIT